MKFPLFNNKNKKQMKRGPKPKLGIQLFTIETGIPLPTRPARQETALFEKKMLPLAKKMKPLVNSIPIPKKNLGMARRALRKHFPTRIYQVAVIKDNPTFARIFRKK